MKIENLSCLLEIVKCGSINKASEKLNFTHQALSSIVKNLEQEFGVPLFNRTNTGTILTDEGKYVYQTAQEIVDELEIIKKRLVEEHATKVQGSLVIYADKITQFRVLTQVLLDFAVKYPKIQLEVITFPPDKYIEVNNIEENEIYLFSFPSKITKSFPSIHYDIFQRNEILIGIQSNHINQKMNHINSFLIKEKNVIINAEDFDKSIWLRKLLKKCGFNNIYYISNAYDFLRLINEENMFTVDFSSVALS